MIVAIHQPNFCPWLPFFKKVEAADLFVILTHCQFTRDCYQQRFNMGGKWYSMGVNHKFGETIREKQYANPQEDWAKIRRRVNRPVLDELTSFISGSLVNTNVAIIVHLLASLGIKTPIILDYPTELTGTARLVDICRHFKATRYLAGRSGSNYMDAQLFEQAGIAVDYQQVSPDDTKHVFEFL